MTARPLPPPVPPAERPPAPALVEVAGQVMLRQLSATLRGKRFLAAAAVASLAPLLAIVMRDPSTVVLERIVANALLIFLLPLLAVSLGSGLLYDEAQEGTLTYLFVAPVPKSAVVLGKWCAALAAGWAVSAAALGLTLLFSAAPEEARGTLPRAFWLAVLFGYPAYLGVFTLLGTLSRWGFLAGLLYAFGYELFVVTFVPGAAKRVSLGFFLKSLVELHSPGRSPVGRDFFRIDPLPEATCIAVLAAAAILGVVIALLVVPRKEFRARNVQG